MKPIIRLAGERPGLAAEPESPRRRRRRFPPAPRGGRRSRGSPPVRRNRRAWSSAPPATPGRGPEGTFLGAAGFAVGDDHDHRRVRSRELVAAAAGAVQHVAGLPGLQTHHRTAGNAGSTRATRPARSRAAPAGRRPCSRHQGLHHRAQHHPLITVAGRVLGSTITAKCSTPSRSPSSTRGRPAPPAVTPTRAVRRPAAPEHRRSPAPGSPGRRTLVEPPVVGAVHAVPVVGVRGQRDVRQHPAPVGVMSSSPLRPTPCSRHEHPHRRRARPDRADRPAARRPAAGEVDRGDVPRRRHLLQRGARHVRLHRHLAGAAGVRCRAPAWASRRCRSTSTSCSRTTTCSGSSGSGPAARSPSGSACATW